MKINKIYIVYNKIIRIFTPSKKNTHKMKTEKIRLEIEKIYKENVNEIYGSTAIFKAVNFEDSETSRPMYNYNKFVVIFNLKSVDWVPNDSIEDFRNLISDINIKCGTNLVLKNKSCYEREGRLTQIRYFLSYED